MPRNIIDSVQSTLDFLIVKTLSWGELHGYAIARWISSTAPARTSRSRRGCSTRQCTTWRTRGWIAAEWGLSENNRRARFYRLTAEGKRELAARAANWKRFTKGVDRIVGAAPEES